MNVFKYLRALFLLPLNVEKLMTTQAELVDQVNAATATIVKVGDETRSLLAKIQDLLAVIAAGGEATPALAEAVAALVAQAAVVDSLVDDLPTP